MNLHVKRIEAVAEQLCGTGGAQAMSAVVQACNKLHQFRESLDAKNRALAALALCSVLDQRHLADTILDLAQFIREE